jgi:sulfur carrier protein ThiS
MPLVNISVRGRSRPISRRIRAKSAVIEDIIIQAGLNPQEVLVKLNGEFVPDIQRARDGDRIELLEITSRG